MTLYNLLTKLDSMIAVDIYDDSNDSYIGTVDDLDDEYSDCEISEIRISSTERNTLKVYLYV